MSRPWEQLPHPVTSASHATKQQRQDVTTSTESEASSSDSDTDAPPPPQFLKDARSLLPQTSTRSFYAAWDKTKGIGAGASEGAGKKSKATYDAGSARVQAAFGFLFDQEQPENGKPIQLVSDGIVRKEQEPKPQCAQDGPSTPSCLASNSKYKANLAPNSKTIEVREDDDDSDDSLIIPEITDSRTSTSLKGKGKAKASVPSPPSPPKGKPQLRDNGALPKKKRPNPPSPSSSSSGSDIAILEPVSSPKKRKKPLDSDVVIIEDSPFPSSKTIHRSKPISIPTISALDLFKPPRPIGPPTSLEKKKMETILGIIHDVEPSFVLELLRSKECRGDGDAVVEKLLNGHHPKAKQRSR